MAYSAEYKEANKEKIKAYHRAYYQRNKEELDKKNKANNPKYAEQQKKYRAEHKEQANARHARWRSKQENMDKISAEAVKWRKTNPDKYKVIKRRAVLKAQYGLSLEDFDAMAASQGFACAICKIVPIKTLHVDHDHNTGKVRGLLCSKCNTALGLLKDNTEFLARAINYLSI